MGRNFRSARNFIGNNGSTIIAISSLFVAALSLYFTIQAQDDDRGYKELLIRPAMAIQTHSSDFSVEFANEGLGPAEIKAVVYQFGGECLSMLDGDGALSKTQHEKASEGIVKRLLTDIFSFEIPNTPGMLIDTRTSLLLPKSIIATGSKHVIFRIADSSQEVFQTKLHALNRPLRQAVMDRFTGMALTIPISMKYCSMSGKYCQTSLRDDGSGKRCEIR